MQICRISQASVRLILALGSATSSMASADVSAPFDGVKSEWHEGFTRFDYLMDENTLKIEPFKRTDDEKFGIKDPPAGKRRCIVIAPKQAAAGNPWSWRGCYWDHQPQTEVELLKRGFHVAYISANANLKPGKTWDAWYTFLTEKHGLSLKPAFIGMSRGGEYAYTWATANPTKISCIYADNPAITSDALEKLDGLAAADVPILHVCGSIDPLLGRSGNTIETIYRQLGGRISSMIKEGAGHHPHSLRTPSQSRISFRIAPNRQCTTHLNLPAAEFSGPRSTASRIRTSICRKRDCSSPVEVLGSCLRMIVIRFKSAELKARSI